MPVSVVPQTAHVRIKAPYVDDFDGIRRESVHSAIVQPVCDTTCVMLNFVARWPGGTHGASLRCWYTFGGWSCPMEPSGINPDREGCVVHIQSIGVQFTHLFMIRSEVSVVFMNPEGF